MLQVRRRQLAYIARYGRQDALQWRRVPIPVLDSMCRELTELVNEENALGGENG